MEFGAGFGRPACNDLILRMGRWVLISEQASFEQEGGYWSLAVDSALDPIYYRGGWI